VDVSSGLIIAPNGLGARRKEPLSREEIRLVTDFERWCTSRGLAMDLFCRHCYDAGEPPRCKGDNSEDATVFKIVCGCRDRVYGQ
jgi:hypothetical protein